MTPEDKAPPKDNVMTECRIAFEKMFSHLDLGSIGGKNYTSKRTNNHWRGFQAAWNIRDVAPDPTQSPDQGAVEALEKENRKLKFQSELDRRAIDRWVPCSDHRDKTKENHCYVCENETLKRKLEQALTRTPVWWGIDYGTRETSVVDGKVTHRDIEPPVTRTPLDLDGLKAEIDPWVSTTIPERTFFPRTDVARWIELCLSHLQAIRPDLFGGKI